VLRTVHPRDLAVVSLPVMAVPARVPIAREAGYRTDTIGRYQGGQFYTAVYGAHRDDDQAAARDRERIRWHASLHLFGADGNHRESPISLFGLAPARGTTSARGQTPGWLPCWASLGKPSSVASRSGRSECSKTG
jgi:hypothetical protein